MDGWARVAPVLGLLGLLGLTPAACTTPAPIAPACRPWSGSSTSTDPPTHCLYFPGATALDPLGDVLYVANTNADLSFGGASLIPIDVLRHERAAACFRRFGTDDGGDSSCGQISCSDSGWALGPSASIEDMELREAQSKQPAANFDRCYCRRDLDDPNIVNCEAQRFILADQGIKLGFFPAALRVLAEDPPNWSAASADTQLHRGLYLAVRGDPSVTFVDAVRPLNRGRSALQSAQLTLSCGDDGMSIAAHQPGQPYRLRSCADANRIQQTPDQIPVDPNVPDGDMQPRLTVPPEPMGLSIDRGCIEAGYRHDRGSFLRDPAQNPQQHSPCYSDDGMGHVKQDGHYYQYLVTSHLGTGQVASFDLGQSAITPQPPSLQDVSDPLLPADGGGRRGAISIAARIPGDLSQPWYVTSRISGSIASFRLASAAGPKVVPGISLSVSNQFSAATQDVRDFVFEPGGQRAFAAIYNPPALALLDTSSRGGSGVPVNQVTSVVNLCLGPSRIALAKVPRPYMGGTVLATRIYVTCYLSGQVAEIDGESGELIATMQVGSGPLSISLNFGNGTGGTAIDPCADPYVGDDQAALNGVTCPAAGSPDLRLRPFGAGQPALGPRAYVTTYLDNAISVLDLDPRSPSYRRVVSRIGLPTPKQVQ